MLPLNSIVIEGEILSVEEVSDKRVDLLIKTWRYNKKERIYFNFNVRLINKDYIKRIPKVGDEIRLAGSLYSEDNEVFILGDHIEFRRMENK